MKEPLYCHECRRKLGDAFEKCQRCDGGIAVLFDGPPGPTAGRFVEVEDANGKSIRVGNWEQRGKMWALVLTRSELARLAQ